MEYCTKKIPLTGNVAETKNKALKEMLATDKDYFFLVEDNCEVLDRDVYDKFIEVSKATGIETLFWPQKNNFKLPFDDDKYISYYKDFDSEFAMYTRNVVNKVGFFDEKMPLNTWQELEYAKRIGDIGLGTPFGVFAAPKDIDSYFELAYEKDEFKNVEDRARALDYWEEKDGEDFPITRPSKQVFKPREMEMV